MVLMRLAEKVVSRWGVGVVWSGQGKKHSYSAFSTQIGVSDYLVWFPA